MTFKSKVAIILLVLISGTLNTAFAAKPELVSSIKFDNIGQSEVLAWSWGASQSGSFHTGGGGGAGKANFQDLSVTKLNDHLSATLLRMVATGEYFDEVVLTAGDQTIEMRRVMVTSISMGRASAEKMPAENITLNFAEFCYRQEPEETCLVIAETSPY